jgi:hypothetical protein
MNQTPAIPLKDLQAWMQQMIIDPEGAGEAPAGLESFIKSSSKLSGRQHLNIYQRAYVARLRDCMAKQFSALEYALGKDLFQGFADEYLEANPSTSYTLMDLGVRFADFLEATRPDKDQRESWPDFMIELIQFEYHINFIFDSKADENYLLADTSTPDEQLQLVPVFELFAFQYPVHWYYTEFINNREPELPFPQASYSVIKRHNYRVGLFELRPEQYLFLHHLKAGRSVAEAKQMMVECHDGQAAQLQAAQLNEVWPHWWKAWISAGFFAAQGQCGRS